MRGFLNKLEEVNKKKKPNLYGEADIDGFDTSTFDLPDYMGADNDPVPEPEEPEVPEFQEPEDDTGDDIPEPEPEEPEFTDPDPDDGFDPENPELQEDAGEPGDTPNEDNAFTEGEDEDTPVFRRKTKKLNKAFASLYDQYKDLIAKLKNIDATGDKATVINTYIDEYEENLQALVEYVNDNTDTWVIRFQTYVEFRATFATINKKLSSIEEDVNILS